MRGATVINESETRAIVRALSLRDTNDLCQTIGILLELVKRRVGYATYRLLLVNVVNRSHADQAMEEASRGQ